jgi:hypothetical protein
MPLVIFQVHFPASNNANQLNRRTCDTVMSFELLYAIITFKHSLNVVSDSCRTNSWATDCPKEAHEKVNDVEYLELSFASWNEHLAVGNQGA